MGRFHIICCLWFLSIVSSLVFGRLDPHGHCCDCIAEWLFVAGRCITAMFRKFHPEHFVCAFCLKQLNKGTFKEQNDKPYCHACFDKLFGWAEICLLFWVCGLQGITFVTSILHHLMYIIIVNNITVNKHLLTDGCWTNVRPEYNTMLFSSAQ